VIIASLHPAAGHGFCIWSGHEYWRADRSRILEVERRVRPKLCDVEHFGGVMHSARDRSRRAQTHFRLRLREPGPTRWGGGRT
jgi:hypothetical protein